MPASAAVGTFIDAAFLGGFVDISQHGGIDDIRVGGVYPHPGDMAAVFQADVLPGFPGIYGFPGSIAGGNVAPHCFLASAYVDDVGVGLGDFHRAYTAAKKTVGYAFPAIPAVGGLPYPAPGSAEIKKLGVSRNTGYRSRPPATEGADEAVLYGGVQFGLKGGRCLG